MRKGEERTKGSAIAVIGKLFLCNFLFLCFLPFFSFLLFLLKFLLLAPPQISGSAYEYNIMWGMRGGAFFQLFIFNSALSTEIGLQGFYCIAQN